MVHREAIICTGSQQRRFLQFHWIPAFSKFDSQVWIGEKECRPCIEAPMPDWLMLQNSPTNEPDLK